MTTPSPTWEPQFDCCAAGQEELLLQFVHEIAGPRGQPGCLPDPVRLLEMAEALYQVERREYLASLKETNFLEITAAYTERCLQALPFDRAVPVARMIEEGAGIELRVLVKLGHNPRVQTLVIRLEGEEIVIRTDGGEEVAHDA